MNAVSDVSDVEPPSGPVLSLTPALCRAFDAVSSSVLIHAGDKVVYANTAMQRLLGYPLAEFMRMQFHGWAAPAFAEDLKRYGLQCLSDPVELPAMELEAITLSGSMRVVELTARCLVLETHALAVFTCQDLSDIRHVQTSLLNVGRVLQQIIENNPVATFVVDAAHRVTHWNAACAQLTHRDAYDVLGRDDAWSAFYAQRRPLLADLIVDGTLEESAESWYGNGCVPSATIANAYEAESFFPDLGDGGRWLYFTAAPLIDAQGTLIGAIETLQDVTQRHLADEEILRHRNELEAMVADRTAELLITHHDLEAFLENASVGIIATASQRILRGNRKFNEMFELGDMSAHGLSTRNFFASESDFAELGKVAYPVLSRGESLSHEMEMLTMAGNKLWVQLIAYVANPAEPTEGTWWLLQDRTEVRRVQRELQLNYERIKQTNTRLEEAQNQLLQAEKMASIGQLAAGVAHEINNPIGFVSSNLGTLRGYVEPLFKLLTLLRKTEAMSLPPAIRDELSQLSKVLDLAFIQEDLPQLLDESQDGLIRVKKIVQDLKNFSRVDHAEWQDADLNAGLDSTLNVVMNEVKYKATVTKKYAALPPVHCIAAQLNQVFMNLIVNAAHAIPERGEIQITTESRGDWVCVEIRDTGVGMTEEIKRRIFEPFFTTKPVGEGTGLGLSLSFSIIQKHGGRIEVDSEPGMGTSFRILLPVNGRSPN